MNISVTRSIVFAVFAGGVMIMAGLGLNMAQRKADSKIAEHPDVPRPVVIVEPGEMDTSGSGGILIRELGRQAVMIAAREGLGARTRDMTLMDAMPGPDATNAITIRLWMSATTNRFGLKMMLLAADGTITQLLAHTIETPGREFMDYEALITNLESMSRSTFIAAIKSAGIAPVNTPRASSGQTISANASLWENIDIFDHWAALRALHDDIRTQGESSANLAELARGYANMAQMTSFCWNSMDKACMARALLYAQRLVITRPDIPLARAYRAYARAMCERHGPALEDIAAVRKACANQTNILPAWLDIVEAYCRYQTAALDVRARKESNNQLLALLRVRAVRNSESATVRLNTIKDALKKAPICSLLYDEWCAVPGVSVGHQATTQSPIAFSRTIYNKMSRMKILPSEIRELALQDVKQQSGKWSLARAVMDDKLPGFQDSAIRTKLIHSLYAACATDSQEPSLAMLGGLIESITFVQIQRRLYFMAKIWGLPSEDLKELLATVRPYIATHPYRAFIESYGLNPQRDKSVYTQLIGGLIVTDVKSVMAPMIKTIIRYGGDLNHGYHRHLNLYTQSDQIAGDMESRLQSKLTAKKKTDKGNGLMPYITELELISPFSPVAVTARIQTDWDQSTDRIPAWESYAPEQPDISRALALKYQALKRYPQAEPFLHLWVKQTHDYSAYQALAENFLLQGQTNDWLAALEDALTNVQETGLNHASIQVKIARYYMRRGQWSKAIPYAETAAQTWAAWAMICAAQCYEGDRQWAQAEKWVRRNTERYDSERLIWYCWCRRTGHGDEPAALAFANKHAASFEHSDNSNDRYWAAVFYQLSGNADKARKIWSQAYMQNLHPYPGLHAVLLQTQLNRVHERDALLEIIAERSGNQTGKGHDLAALNALAGLLKRYLAGVDFEDFDEKVERIIANSDNDDEREYLCYFVGYFYELMGETELSVAYYKRADDLLLPGLPTVYLAGAALQRCNPSVKW